MNKKRSIPIDPEKVKQALKEAQIKRKDAADRIGISDSRFRASVNSEKRLQPEILHRLAIITNKDEDYFRRTESITITEDYTLPSGKTITKGTMIPIPEIGSDRFTKLDVKSLHDTFYSLLWFYHIGETYSKMNDDEKLDFRTCFESWFHLFAMLQANVTYSQFDEVLDMVETLVEGYIAKHPQE